MKNAAMLCIIGAVIGFIMAVIGVVAFGGEPNIMGVRPEGFSSGATNLALIAIALGAWFRNDTKGS